MRFSGLIIRWYQGNKRDLPWRNTSDPYLIWLSEIILQQTRVDQGLPYYLKFAKEFPRVKQLAEAKEDKILKLWQGLGYYSRARNLHAAAKQVIKEHKGNFPQSYNELKTLKGVGDYTAAAIASFAFNQPHAVVDGNVYRVLARVFGLTTPIDSSTGKKQFSQLANDLLDKKRPALHNQAIMEFGALYCKPQNPNCANCCLSDICVAFSKKVVDQLPVKEKKTKQQNRYFHYLVIKNKNKILLNKRGKKDIWENLYDFPLIETAKNISEKELLGSKEWKKLLGKGNYTLKLVSSEQKHILSHRIILAKFYEIEQNSLNKDILQVPLSKLSNYAVPRLISRYIKSKEKDWGNSIT